MVFSLADFYNWKRVKLRYCDGVSFGGDSEYRNGVSVLHKSITFPLNEYSSFG